MYTTLLHTGNLYFPTFQKTGACIALDKGPEYWCMSFLMFLSKFVNDVHTADVMTVCLLKFECSHVFFDPELNVFFLSSIQIDLNTTN